MARSFYVVGGTVPPDSPSYVERRADSELLDAVLDSEFCYVLTARQMGKSSLMARAVRNLRGRGFRTASIDLSLIGETQVSADQWYMGLSRVLLRELGVTLDLKDWWHQRLSLPALQRLTELFLDVILSEVGERMVVFVDEIDTTLRLPFADDLFAAIRGINNARALQPECERICFVLLGAATPTQLIQDPTRTPFNVGRRIDLTDFTREEASVLLSGLDCDSSTPELLDRILYWTDGHPYLTQKLCRVVADHGVRLGDGPALVDRLVEKHFLGPDAIRSEANLSLVASRLKQDVSASRDLLRLLTQIRHGATVPDKLTSPIHALLKLSGVVIAGSDGLLRIRNRIYHQVFTAEWAKTDRTLAALWRRRALRYAAEGDRDRALLCHLRGILIVDDAAERAEAAHLAGGDYDVLAATLRHGGPLTSIVYSPDGQTILTAGEDGSARLWDCLSGEPKTPPLAHRGPVWSIAFSPDGNLLATGSNDGTAVIWSIEGVPLSPPLRHESQVTAVVFSPDSRAFLTCGEDGTARLWDVGSHDRPLFLMAHEGPVDAAVFSPDGKYVLTLSGGLEVRIWSASNGRESSPRLVHDRRVMALAISPDGRVVLTAGESRIVRLWDAASGLPTAQFDAHEGFILTAGFSPDGTRIVTGSDDRAARLWNAITGESAGHPFLHENWVRSASFLQSGELLLTGSEDMTARCWDAASGKPVGPSLHHRGRIVRAAFSPDGSTAATASSDGSARLWSVPALRSARTTPAFRHDAPISSMALSPDGHLFASGTEKGIVCFCDSRSSCQRFDPVHHSGAIRTIEFSNNGALVLTGSEDGAALVWHLSSSIDLAFAFQLGTVVRSAAIRADAGVFVTGTWDGAFLWSLDSGRQIGQPLRHTGMVHAVLFSPDGLSILTAGADNLVRLWSSVDGAPIRTFFHEDMALALGFSPDGRLLATGSRDSGARLFDVETGAAISLPLLHKGPVESVAFSPDGTILATAGSDHSTRLWRTDTGAPLAGPLNQDGPIHKVAFSADGKRFFCLTDRWVHAYSSKGTPAASRHLPGAWGGALRVSESDGYTLQVGVRLTPDSALVVPVELEAAGPPIAGDPAWLLSQWEQRLDLRVDEEGRSSSRWPMRPAGGRSARKARFV